MWSARGFGSSCKLVVVAIFVLATACLGQSTAPPWRNAKYTTSVDLKVPLGSLQRGKVVLETQRFQLWLEGDARNKCSLSVREKYTGRGPPSSRPGDRGFLLWSANYYSHTPTGATKCTLIFTAEGDLQLWIVYKGKNSLTWSSNTANQGVKRMALETNPDQGNFKLLTASKKVVFSSFNVKEWLVLTGEKFWGELLKSPDLVYPSNDTLVLADAGTYILALRDNDLQLLLNGPKPQPYWSLKLSVGVDTDLSQVQYAARVEDAAQGIGLYTAGGKLVYRIAVPPWVPEYGADYNFGIDYYGNLNYNLMYKGASWGAGWQAIANYCYLPRYCGDYGICTWSPIGEPNATCSGCPQGFTTDSSTTPPGCKRKKSINKCNHSNYLEMPGFDMATFPTLITETFDACKSHCSADCNCDGFFYNFKAGNCVIVTQFLTLIKTTVNTATSVYIKV